MASGLIDLRQPRASADDLQGLHECLAQLIGEPFRFARVTYGDELTLHFGELRPARSARLIGKLNGSYILGMRGSSWLLKSSGAAIVLNSAVDLKGLPASLGTPLQKSELEASPLLAAESRVLTAIPFLVRPAIGFGLHIRTSDGSSVVIVPTPPHAGEPEDVSLPEIADWELLSPHGLLRAGPACAWAFEPMTCGQ